jgi:hypothetical protein
MPSPEELARKKINKLLTEPGWILENRSTINLSAGQGDCDSRSASARL